MTVNAEDRGRASRGRRRRRTRHEAHGIQPHHYRAGDVETCGVVGPREHEPSLQSARQTHRGCNRDVAQPAERARLAVASDAHRRLVNTQPIRSQGHRLIEPLHTSGLQTGSLEVPHHVLLRPTVLRAASVAAAHLVVCQSPNVRPPTARRRIRLRGSHYCTERQRNGEDDERLRFHYLSFLPRLGR